MKNIFFILLFLLAIHCGAADPTSNFSDFDGSGRGKNFFAPTEIVPGNAVVRNTPQIPGYVCNAEGICIPEKRVKKRPENVDAFGFRKNIIGVPYDPCRDDGQCGGND
ncbi:MAG TPA: hypothetical protein DDW49_01930 [Deltaproteobacteria bacterium]|nr:MAG: hypothetical protein A2048_10980 [Deltaproteobacteria bacterium GWA2_45_12]HBF12143.1 hypothetical protein [Deltaproteobacteria bacterium]